MNFKHLVITCCMTILCLSIIIIVQLNHSLQPKIKPYVLCTTSIIADTVANIAGDTIKTISLMGPGIDPHLYKPVESDVLKIASADIIFYNGLHLEAKMADLFVHLAQKKITIAVTKDIPQSMLLAVDNYQEIFDPHVWFDIHLWLYAVQTICDALMQKFPEYAIIFQENSDRYTQQLKNVYLQTCKIMERVPQNKRILITGHDAFSYFGRRYNFNVLGIQGISTESTPGAYDLANIIEYICQHNVPALFIESSIPIKNCMAIQQGVAAYGKVVKLADELYSDALGDKYSDGSSYIDMILHNVQTIANALQT